MERTVLTLIVSLVTLGILWSQPEETEFSDRYTLTFDAIEPRIIRVEAQLQLEDSLLYMSPYGPMPQRWPQYIRNLTVKSSEGKPLIADKTEEGYWIVPGIRAGDYVLLSYEMLLEHEKIAWPGGIDGVAFRRDWGVMASGRSLFVMNGKNKNNIQVYVETPENWRVSTPWSPSNTAGTAYSVANLDTLQESFLVTGTHEEINIAREGFTLKFILGDDQVKGERSRYLQVATGVMEYYIDLMGGTPKPPPGMDLKHSLVIINQSENIDGEVIGNHISMFMNPEGNSMDQMMGWFMFAHEFFHLWNGKTLRFADTTTDWFKEGVSNYYTIKALMQTGFINEAAVFAVLNNLFYQRYIKDPGYGSLSPSQAASGFDKDNHWGLVYGGGLFAGIAMDMEIRHQTGNFSSLDDLMRSFYKEYGGTDRLIGQEDILIKANQLGSTDFEGFMKDHIQGPNPISLTPYLKFAGVLADTKEGQLQLTHIPEKTRLQQAIWTGFLGGSQED